VAHSSKSPSTSQYFTHVGHTENQQESLLSQSAQRARLICETRILPIGGQSLGPNFTGTGSSHAKMLIPFDRYIDCTTTLPLEVFRQ